MRKKSFVYNSAILIISAIIVKLIGAFFKIPLTNILGGNGMAYFSCAYSIFMPVYALSVTGLPVAVAKLISEANAKSDYQKISEIKSASFEIFISAGFIFTFIVIALSYPFCKYIANLTFAWPSVIMIAPTIIISCIISVYRGYYEGLNDMYPTAISQIIESVVKIISGLLFSYKSFEFLNNNPETVKKIAFFFNISSSENEIIYSLSSAAAISGITLSSFIGMLFMILKPKSDKSIIKNKKFHNKALYKSLIKIALPVSAGSLITSLTTLSDLTTITYSIEKIIEKSPNFFAFLNINRNETAGFIYGSFVGLAITVFNLVPSVVNMFGKSIFPLISEAKALNNHNKIRKSIEKALLTSAFFAIPSGLGIAFLSKEILTFLFKEKVYEILISYKSLSILGIGVIFLSLSTTVFSMLQATGRNDIPLKAMVLGTIIKVIGNILLVPIPEININGAAISTTISYIVIFILSILSLLKESKMKITKNIKHCTVIIIYSSLMCGLTAKIAHNILSNFLSYRINLLLSIVFGGFIYLIFIVTISYFDKSAVKSIKNSYFLKNSIEK